VPDVPYLIDARAVGVLLGKSADSVRANDGRRGFPQSRKIGGSRRWDADEIARYADIGRTE